MPYEYTWDMDPANTTCTNTDSTIKISGPTTINYPNPNVVVHFKQNDIKYSDPLASLTMRLDLTDFPTDGLLKKTLKTGNPYISYADKEDNQLIQLGRCVTPSSQSVYNRMRAKGNPLGLFSATIDDLSCNNKGSSLSFEPKYIHNAATGNVYLTNQFLTNTSDFTGPSVGASLSVTVNPPNSYSKSGRIDTAVAGNPFVSFQAADCDLTNFYNYDYYKTTYGDNACKEASKAQYRTAKQNSASSNNYFPYTETGEINLNYKDFNDNGWAIEDTAVTRKLKDFVLWGPVLNAETTPKRCNKL